MLWLEVMSLKSFGHGDLEGELNFRERERERRGEKCFRLMERMKSVLGRWSLVIGHGAWV